MGRIKDLLIVDGSNHYPDDIEATIREITGGRVAASRSRTTPPRIWWQSSKSSPTTPSRTR